MRRIKVEHRVWHSDDAECSGTIIRTRDYRLMRAVVRAAEKLMYDDAPEQPLARALDAFNAPEKRK